jgi:hypothetical protein
MLLPHVAAGEGTRHEAQVASFTQASAWLQQLLSTQVSQAGTPLEIPHDAPPSAAALVHSEAHCDAQATWQMHVLTALSWLTADAPAVVAHMLSQACVVQPARHELSAVQLESITHVLVCDAQPPVCAALLHDWQAASAALACVPIGLPAR